jgi:outer membrane protein OmpA-like peptidoglycan-associated protein
MRILITGFVVFVVWSFFSIWIYVDKIVPELKKPVIVTAIPEPKDNVADSLAKIEALKPKALMIYFEFNKVNFKADPLTDNSIPEFQRWIEKYPDYKLSVTGHTDLVGNPEYNQNLGMKRANEIRKYLIAKGIDAQKIEVFSMGETLPAANNFSSEGRRLNRRVEVLIKK